MFSWCEKMNTVLILLITDLADSSEAPPLREQFSDRSTNSVIVISDFVHMHKIEI